VTRSVLISVAAPGYRAGGSDVSAVVILIIGLDTYVVLLLLLLCIAGLMPVACHDCDYMLLVFCK
jgi:hypothetical protein